VAALPAGRQAGRQAALRCKLAGRQAALQACRLRTLGHLQRDLGHLGQLEDALEADVIVHAAARHELHQDAEVGLPRAGTDELHHVLVPHLAHDTHLLHACTGAVSACVSACVRQAA
jgi:hypothetical protein